jgi:hypothetical protein
MPAKILILMVFFKDDVIILNSEQFMVPMGGQFGCLTKNSLVKTWTNLRPYFTVHKEPQAREVNFRDDNSASEQAEKCK